MEFRFRRYLATCIGGSTSREECYRLDGYESVALTEAGMVIAELAIRLARVFAHLVHSDTSTGLLLCPA